ncbi:hypothetical protein RJ639_019816 [Escallonia herrerae]|uniref:Integrase catalytic domain-containing protein n=1 Tax=Escallonia herrerae TaxID=1293975 RepID=A0AA88V6Z3_9ASTE|nr:hypothetical protein RJ639_019816 [Escallonia herrerae]
MAMVSRARYTTYFSVISRPTDFETIKTKLVDGIYTSREEFKADVRLTLSNAMTYNTESNVVHLMARKSSEFFYQISNAANVDEDATARGTHTKLRLKLAFQGCSSCKMTSQRSNKYDGCAPIFSINGLSINRDYAHVPYPSLLVCKQSDNSRQSLSTHSIRPANKERCVSIFIDMAKDAETSKPKHFDPTSEYYLSSQANSGNSLSKDTLKGDNYVAWEQSAILTLKSHNKLVFINGRITKPDPKSEDFLAWDIFNSTLCSWICNSLDPPIRATVSRLNEAKLIWDSLKTRYSIPNRPRIYKLWSDASMTTQGGASVMTYYTKLLGLWDELLTLSPLESCGCPKGTEKMNWYQDLQTYQFLMGLDDKYATLRTQIINMDPFPNIDRVYAMVMQEESHRGVTGSRDTTPAVGFHTQNGLPTARSSGLVSATAGDPDRTPTGWPQCTFCHRVGHTQEKCYRRLGIAPPGKGRGRGRGSPAVGSLSGPLQATAATTQNNSPSLSQAQAAATSALPGLTPEQMQRLITFLESSPSGTDSLVGKSLPTKHTWLIDSGASHHMTGNLNFFSSIWDIPPSLVGIPDGLQTNAIKAGSVSLADDITLHHVLYVPNLAVNLISVSCLASDTNCFVAFSHDICVLQDRTSKSPIGLVAAVSESESYELWHRRMGHSSSQPLIHLSTVPVVSPSLKTICDVCCRAKHTRTVFPDSIGHVMDIFGLIHCDIWGPYRVSTISGAKYFLTIVNDYSRVVWVYLMHDKGQTGTLLRNFCNMVHTQFGKLVKIIWSYNGHEFDSQPMTQFYNDHGILHQTSMVDTPKQNERVERKHRHILEVARALRFQANLPIEFWGECVLTAAHLINHTPLTILKHKTPHELLFQRVSSYSHLWVFGCLCYAHTKFADKFAPRSRCCVFLGYPLGKKGWRVYDLETNQVFFSRVMKFEETVFLFTTPLGPSPTPTTTTFCPAWDYAEHPMASPPVIGKDTTSDRGDLPPPPAATPPLVCRVSPWVLTPRSPLRLLHRALLLLRLPLLVVERDKRKLLLFSGTMYVTLLKFFPPVSSTPTNGSSGPRYPLANFVS